MEVIIKDEFLTCEYSLKFLKKLDITNQVLKDIGNQMLNLQQIKKAMIYAKYYHGDQMRLSGEKYYSHPFEVAYILLDYAPITNGVVIALLHDTLEDTNLTKEEIEEEFGAVVAQGVLDLTRKVIQGKKEPIKNILETLWKDKKFIILLIKCLDRLHNMETVRYKSAEFIKRTLPETLQYFPILFEFLELPNLTDILHRACMKVLPISKKKDFCSKIEEENFIF